MEVQYSRLLFILIHYTRNVLIIYLICQTTVFIFMQRHDMKINYCAIFLAQVDTYKHTVYSIIAKINSSYDVRDGFNGWVKNVSF